MIPFHAVNGAIALMSGLGVLLLRKGTGRHKAIGRVYVVALYTLCLASVFITDSTPLFNGFGLFHGASVASIATLTAGLVPVPRRKRQRRWYSQHFDYMLWSYVGLIMAFNSHFITQVQRFLITLTHSPAISWPLTMLTLLGIRFLIGSIYIPPKVRAYRGLFEHRATFEARRS